MCFCAILSPSKNHIATHTHISSLSTLNLTIAKIYMRAKIREMLSNEKSKDIPILKIFRRFRKT